MSEATEHRVVRTIPDSEHVAPGVELITVHVLAAPVLVWDRASAHTADLLREFALLTIGAENGLTRGVPGELLELVAELRARYAGISADQTAELDRAVEAGECSRDFTYRVPVAVSEACAPLLALLDAADEYCAGGRELMTLVSPGDQRDFRHWYLGEFIRQIAGEAPQPWTGPLT